jgi:(p)ppGpp synthase/HD superfamily hydrolase
MKVVAYDKPNLLVELASVISDMNITIKNCAANVEPKTRIATFRFVVEIKTREQMDKLVKQLMRKSDVIDVFRA